MKFMVLVKSNPQLEAEIGDMSEAAMKESLAKMGAFNDELKKGWRAERLRWSAPEPRRQARAF